MKLGQMSVVHFASQIVGTVVGFLVTLYLARVLGAEILGVYFLVIAIVSWLELPSTIGIRTAISKRISEGTDQGAYLVSGGILIGTLAIITVVTVWLLRGQVNDYIGKPVAGLVGLLLTLGVSISFLKAVLIGQRRVGIVGLLTPVQTIARGAMQVSLVVFGFQLAGLLIGHAIGSVAAILLGLLAASFVLNRPSRRHFDRLLSFAKFSWLGQIRGRTFNRMDIIILGLFVGSGLIGVYSVAWNVASVLGIFAASMSTTLFPELSRLSAAERPSDVSELLEVALSYAGLIHIPGLVGILLLGNRILRLYGDEFVRGTAVLAILVTAYLVQSFNQQILTTLDAIDRPDLAFQSNAGLVGSNIVLNMALVYLIGWVGAAVGTALSVGVGFVIGFWHIRRHIEFEFPVGMVTKQVISATLMGAVVGGSLWMEATYGLLSNNVVVVLLLVGIGAALYVLILLTISPRFRTIVRDNLSFEVSG